MTTARLFVALWIGAVAICGGAAAEESSADGSGAGMPYSRYYGTIMRVIDGDTLVVQVRIWPRLTAEYAVRVRGIDTPETYRPACPAERRQGEAASAFLAGLYPVGLTVRLDDVESGAFSGRVVADVGRREGEGWRSLRDEMISAGMAVVWRPGQPKPPWCEMARNAAPGE